MSAAERRQEAKFSATYIATPNLGVDTFYGYTNLARSLIGCGEVVRGPGDRPLQVTTDLRPIDPALARLYSVAAVCRISEEAAVAAIQD
jgi:hypothetical protein